MIEGTIVALKPLRQEDMNEYIEISSVCTDDYTNYLYCKTREEWNDFVEAFVEDKEYRSLKITECTTGKMVGLILINEIREKIWDVSYFISPKYRCKGYCKEAVKLLELTAQKEGRILQFIVSKSNNASSGVMKSLGANLIEITNKFIYYAI